MTALSLKSFKFRRERERSWRELESLVNRAERGGVKALSETDRLRLPILYRGALSSLSVARAISLDRALLDYLEALCQRAYFVVYGPRQSARTAIWRFLSVRFPATVRRYAGAVLLAGLFLVAGGLAGYLLTNADPERYYSFVPDGMAQGRDPTATTEFLRDGLYDQGTTQSALATFSAFLFTHNAKVGMLCFAIGFAAGIPVFILLFQTGLMLGAFSWLYMSRGLGIDWWGWVLPHGVTELLAVVLCGAGGLAMAKALVFPGRLRRLDALARVGREAAVIVAGAVLMFFIAGLLEGFFRQMVTDPATRYAVVFLTAAFWLSYFTLAGRRGAA
jgi:uncharacterized membrane protein SpoIIM required for sporulation